mgnify:CR=1 FL=1
MYGKVQVMELSSGTVSSVTDTTDDEPTARPRRPRRTWGIPLGASRTRGTHRTRRSGIRAARRPRRRRAPDRPASRAAARGPHRRHAHRTRRAAARQARVAELGTRAAALGGGVLGNQFGRKFEVEVTEGEFAGGGAGQGHHASGPDRPVRSGKEPYFHMPCLQPRPRKCSAVKFSTGAAKWNLWVNC